MPDYTRAVFGGLQQGQADFASIYGQLTSTVQDLDSRLRGNLAEWDGQAQQAYYAAKAQWDAAMASYVASGDKAALLQSLLTIEP